MGFSIAMLVYPRVYRTPLVVMCRRLDHSALFFLGAEWNDVPTAQSQAVTWMCVGVVDGSMVIGSMGYIAYL